MECPWRVLITAIFVCMCPSVRPSQPQVCIQTCHNRGRCSSPNTCTCAAGWTGTTCQTPACNSPCLNGGRCTSPFTCTCAAGYAGPTCNTVCPARTYGVGCKHCPCLNGGSCNTFSLSPTCTCTPGWRGSTCGWRCDAAHYGQNCASPCQCRNGATCNHINGQCT
eukprot:scpid106876/ scgid0097/ Multiple epidermal growth factor-like domains protein 10